MTLHEAIERVLVKHGSLSAPEIADEINRLRLYARGDGGRVPATQIHARVRHHPDLFFSTNGKIHLIRAGRSRRSRPLKITPTSQKPPASSAPKVQDVLELGKVGDLMKGGLPNDSRLDQCGVYCLAVPHGYVPRFIAPDEVRTIKNVIDPWDIDRLSAKWVVGTETVYIGLAGDRTPRSLRKRLNDLLEHAQGHTTERGPHKGGEIVWQLRDHHQFRLLAMPTDGPPTPRRVEGALLRMFKEEYGKLPFANRQLGKSTCDPRPTINFKPVIAFASLIATLAGVWLYNKRKD